MKTIQDIQEYGRKYGRSLSKSLGKSYERLTDAAEEYREEYREREDRQSARALGWVSLAIGLTELAATKQIQRLAGVNDCQATGVIRALGVREIMHGIDILSHRDPGPGVTGRVLGDVLDGVVLSAAASKTRRPGGLLAIAAMVLPVVIADMLFAKRLMTR